MIAASQHAAHFLCMFSMLESSAELVIFTCTPEVLKQFFSPERRWMQHDLESLEVFKQVLCKSWNQNVEASSSTAIEETTKLLMKTAARFHSNQWDNGLSSLRRTYQIVYPLPILRSRSGYIAVVLHFSCAFHRYQHPAKAPLSFTGFL